MSLWLSQNKLTCYYVFPHMTLCHYGYRQNKLTCYYVFYYPVHQHHTCGASTHDVRSVSTTETRPQQQFTISTP